MKNIKFKIAIIEHPAYKNQTDFALKIGITPDHLSKIINHGARCNGNARVIARALDKTMEELGLS